MSLPERAVSYVRSAVRDVDLSRAPGLALDAAVLSYSLFVLITLDVVFSGPLREFDNHLAGQPWQRSDPGLNRVAWWLDHIGLRGVTATVLLLVSIGISLRIQWWRPFRLAVLALVSHNVAIGAVKVLMGRTSPRSDVDELLAGGFHYVSGHSANAALSWGLVAYLLYRFTNSPMWVKRGAAGFAVVASVVMTVVSLYRNTHWVTDLVSGVLVGITLLCLIIVVDRVLVRQAHPATASAFSFRA